MEAELRSPGLENYIAYIYPRYTLKCNNEKKRAAVIPTYKLESFEDSICMKEMQRPGKKFYPDFENIKEMLPDVARCIFKEMKKKFLLDLKTSESIQSTPHTTHS